MKLEINVEERPRVQAGEGWITATVEDFHGNVFGSSTAPVNEGATFDVRGAVIRAAVEEAITKLDPEKQGPIGEGISS